MTDILVYGFFIALILFAIYSSFSAYKNETNRFEKKGNDFDELQENQITDANSNQENDFFQDINIDTNAFIYYIFKNNVKIGPLKFSELVEQNILPNDLIWRNDSPDWKKSTSFTELKNHLTALPPLLPHEELKIERKNLFRIALKQYFKYYIGASLLLGIISSILAVNSYDTWPGKGKQSEFGMETPLKYSERYLSPVIGWDYRINNETEYAENQAYIFKPIYAIFATAYLSLNQQLNSKWVYFDFSIASFLLLGLILILFITVKYLLLIYANDLFKTRK